MRPLTVMRLIWPPLPDPRVSFSLDLCRWLLRWALGILAGRNYAKPLPRSLIFTSRQPYSQNIASAHLA
ncbi:hypothetical protein EJB05_39753, partial [Eragrostis curvula]